MYCLLLDLTLKELSVLDCFLSSWAVYFLRCTFLSDYFLSFNCIEYHFNVATFMDLLFQFENDKIVYCYKIVYPKTAQAQKTLPRFFFVYLIDFYESSFLMIKAHGLGQFHFNKRISYLFIWVLGLINYFLDKNQRNLIVLRLNDRLIILSWR